MNADVAIFFYFFLSLKAAMYFRDPLIAIKTGVK